MSEGPAGKKGGGLEAADEARLDDKGLEARQLSSQAGQGCQHPRWSRPVRL